MRTLVNIMRRSALVLLVTAVSLLAARLSSGNEVVRLLILGDSLTAGWGVARNEAFPARLEAALRAQGLNVTVIDAGVSGDTSAGGRARLAWVLGGNAAERPDAAIVELGGNDMLRGLPPEATEANLDAVLRTFGERGIPVLLAGMRAPPNLGAVYVAAFDRIYPRLASARGAVFYPFFLDGVAAVPSLNQPDGIHPNAAGVGVIVERIIPFVRDLVARSTEPAGRGG